MTRFSLVPVLVFFGGQALGDLLISPRNFSSAYVNTASDGVFNFVGGATPNSYVSHRGAFVNRGDANETVRDWSVELKHSTAETLRFWFDSESPGETSLRIGFEEPDGSASPFLREFTVSPGSTTE